MQSENLSISKEVVIWFQFFFFRLCSNFLHSNQFPSPKCLILLAMASRKTREDTTWKNQKVQLIQKNLLKLETREYPNTKSTSKTRQINVKIMKKNPHQTITKREHKSAEKTNNNSNNIRKNIQFFRNPILGNENEM